MTVEQNLKTLLGEYAFQICVLQNQLDELKKNAVVSNNQQGGITAKEVKNG